MTSVYYVISSLSSCCAASTDLPDSLSLPVSIVHCSQEVFQAASCISTELLYIGSSWSSNFCSSMCSGVGASKVFSFFKDLYSKAYFMYTLKDNDSYIYVCVFVYVSKVFLLTNLYCKAHFSYTPKNYL